MKKSVLLCAGTAVLIAAGVGFAQTQPFSETMEVTVIEIPVTVVDRAGNSVRGLTREDFEVTDEGRKVNIIGFETIDLSAVTPADQASMPAPPAAYRNFLLLFDFSNSSPGTIGRAQQAAREFVAGQLGQRDLAAVATLSAEHGLQIVTSFTSDRATLEHAVSTLGIPKYFKVADPLRLAPPPADAAGGGDRKVESGSATAIENLQEMVDATARVNEQEQRGRLRRQFSQLSGVARMLDTLRGQKQIILLSEGFDPKLVQGRQDLSARATQKENDAVLAGEIWNVDSDARFGNSASSSEIGTMAEIFRRSDVTLHAIDIKGLRSDVDASEGSKKSSNEALHLITRPTGGAVFKNASSLSDNFKQLLKQQEMVYLLAFEAKPDKAGKFHSLKIKVPSAKGARVNHRAGYYETTGKASPLEQTLSLADIMMTDADVREVPLAFYSMPLPGKDGAARLPVVVEIPGAGVLEKVTGNSATVTLFVYAFDEQYQIKDYLQQRVAFDLNKSGAQLRSSGMRYMAMLNLPPGKYAVKALVRVEETGRVGFLRTDVDVPAVSGPAILPPVFVNERPGWIGIPAPGTGATASATFMAAGRPFVPARGPVLKESGTYRIALFVQDTPAENLEISPVVKSSDGTTQPAAVSLVGRTPPDSEGAAKVVLEFKPPKMAAGTYELQFTVKPKDRASSMVALPFRVE